MRPHPRTVALALVAVVALTACGGGDDDHEPPPTAAPADPLAGVPASATASSGGFIAYLRDLVSRPSEDREPASLDGVTPPGADTSEPESIG